MPLNKETKPNQTIINILVYFHDQSTYCGSLPLLHLSDVTKFRLILQNMQWNLCRKD